MRPATAGSSRPATGSAAVRPREELREQAQKNVEQVRDTENVYW